MVWVGSGRRCLVAGMHVTMERIKWSYALERGNISLLIRLRHVFLLTRTMIGGVVSGLSAFNFWTTLSCGKV